MTGPVGDVTVGTLGELLAAVEIVAVDTEDFFRTSRIMLELKPGGSTMYIPRGLPGDRGVPGKNGPPYVMKGEVANQAALPGSGRTVGDTWRLQGTTSVAMWSGTAWVIVPNFTGTQGPVGPSPTFEIGSVERADNDLEDPQVYVRATTGGYILDFVLPTRQGPQGEKGDTGASGPFLTAADVVVPLDVGADFVPVFNATDNKMHLEHRPPAVVGPFRFGPGSFTPYTAAAGTSSFQIAQIDFDTATTGRRWSYQFDVMGAVEVQATGFSASALIDIEVHLNSPGGPIIALGSGMNTKEWHAVSFAPGGSIVVPGTPSDVVPANTVGRLYVIARRREGTGSWAVRTDRARLRALQIPIA